MSSKDTIDASQAVAIARYEALMQASAQIVWTTGPTGAAVDDAPAWREFTGQTLERWREFGWLDAVHPGDVSRVRRLWQHALDRRQPMDAEYRVRHVTGGWRWAQVRAVPVLDPDGALREWLGITAMVGGVGIDVTELKAAEAALRESEERYRTLFESIDEGFCIMAQVADEPVDFRFVETNPAFAAHAGIGGVVGKTFRQAFPSEAEEWLLTFGAVVTTGEPIRCERALVTLGRVLELYAFRIPHHTNRRIAVVFKDVTARKEAEAGRFRLSAIVESSDDAIVSKDLNGVIATWNAGAERLFGYTAKEAIGQPVTLLIPPDRLDEEPGVLARIRRGESADHYETVRRRKDGTLVDVSLTVSPIRDSRGTIVGASKIARDITERRKAAEAMREADRRKDEFLAMLAHELRNPLTPILTSIEALRQARTIEPIGEPGQAGQALDVLQRQVGQMVRLVDDLLDASRISRGKVDLRRERVEVSAVVQLAVEGVRPIAEVRGQTLTVTLPAAPVWLNADPARLAQIVGNLLNNACKFTPRDGRIWLAVERDDTGSQVAIRVRDTGIGIARDHLAKVFEMFAQVDTSLERPQAGLGIGLTLVKTLAEMHGGAVDVSSGGRGHGSEFVVRLPVLLDTAVPAAARPPVEAALATPLKILVVDDNRDAADMFAMLLAINGHETHTVHDGLAAVDAAARLSPHVILMDIGLPKLNGFEAARRIRAQQGSGRRPLLVAVTGWGQEDDRRRSREAGFDAHVVKPVDHVALARLFVELGAAKTNP